MKTLRFSATVECYIGLEPYTLDGREQLVHFNVLIGTIVPVKDDRPLNLVNLADQPVYIWPSNPHYTTLSFMARKGILRWTDGKEFVLKIED